MSKGDLTIINDDGVYRITQKQWMQDKNRVDPSVVGDAAVLVKRGALVADVPEPAIPIGYYCYLVNLAQLSDPIKTPKGKPGADTNEPLGDDGILVHTLGDGYYIIRPEDWKKNKVTLNPPEKGTICAEREYGFLVNLPLFTVKDT
jgi:hypothetical protein